MLSFSQLSPIEFPVKLSCNLNKNAVMHGWRYHQRYPGAPVVVGYPKNSKFKSGQERSTCLIPNNA